MRHKNTVHQYVDWGFLPHTLVLPLFANLGLTRISDVKSKNPNKSSLHNLY